MSVSGRFEVVNASCGNAFEGIFDSLDSALDRAKECARLSISGEVYRVVDRKSIEVLVEYWFLVGQLCAYYPRIEEEA